MKILKDLSIIKTYKVFISLFSISTIEVSISTKQQKFDSHQKYSNEFTSKFH